MRRIRSIALMTAGTVVIAALVWRRNRRLGTRFVNVVVNPLLVRKGLAGRGRSEIGTLEHVGRRSGIRRLTPVHPESQPGGFRIVVPLGSESEWVRNVLAAGHCRIQLQDTVYELDEPRVVSPSVLDGIPRVLRALERALGFEYLVLHRFGATEGALAPVTAAGVGEIAPSPAPAEAPAAPAAPEPVVAVG